MPAIRDRVHSLCIQDMVINSSLWLLARFNILGGGMILTMRPKSRPVRIKAPDSSRVVVTDQMVRSCEYCQMAEFAGRTIP